MSTTDHHEITAEERGDTTGPRRKIAAFVGIVAIVGAGVVGIAAVSDRAADDDTPDLARTLTVATIVATLVPDTPATGDIAQAELVDTEDARISRAVARGTTTRHGVTTVVLDKRDTGAYGLKDLIALGAATRKGTTITLHRPVVVRTGASLVIRKPGGTLRLAGTAAGPASIVAWGGRLTLSGSTAEPLTVVGWDRVTKAPDTDETDGRGYVRAHSGRLVSDHVAFEHLGFWSGRTGGLAATGTSFDPGRAQVTDTTIASTHIGLYLVGTRDVTVKQTRISGANRDGIELDRSRRARLTDVTVTGSGVSGIRAHDQSTKLRIMGGSSTDNDSFGIAVDGRPRAVGPNALGYNVVTASGLEVTGTAVSGNAKGGIQVTGTDRVALNGLTVDQDLRPVRIIGRSRATSLLGSVLTTGRGPVVEISDGATGVAVHGNTMTGTTTGVEVSAADVDVTANTITLVKGRAVTVTGDTAAGRVADNDLTGSGNRAFDVADSAAGVVVGTNDTSDWTTTHASLEWLEENPFAPLWIAILLIPAIGLNFIVRRFRMHRDLRRLTEETVIAMARARRHGPLTAPAPVPELVGAGPPHVVLTPDVPIVPLVPVVPAAVRAPEVTAVPETIVVPEVTRTDRLVTRGAMGQFGSAEDLAVHAVLEGGKSPERVARTLQVPVAVVNDWVRRARDQRS
ncbi:MAG: right-handed parallel beta-helix repeat-containing protein [Aeromicrobium sp.]